MSGYWQQAGAVRVPEQEYPESMLVRSVRHKGNIRWKHDVFLTEVLWGEQVGLLPEDDRWFTIYFAQYPIARFDSQQLRVTPWPETKGVYKTPPLIEGEQQVSGMCPV